MGERLSRFFSLAAAKRGSAPDYPTKSVEELRTAAERAKAIEDAIASSYERWEALEEKRQLAENQ